MQHKLIDLNSIEVKFDENRRGFFSGYASVFGGVDAYGDTVMPGAYKSTLEDRNRPVQMRWNHFGEVIGKWTAMHEDEKGLWVEGELTPGHSKAEDVYASLKHGAISGLSIGYRVNKSEPNQTKGLDLYEIDLVEISVVESPADLAAQIGDIKSEFESIKSEKELEAFLREVGGFSHTIAKGIISKAKRPRDVEVNKDEIEAIFISHITNRS